MLDEFIEVNGLKAEIIECRKEVMTVRAAADLLKVSSSQIVKSLLYLDSGNEPVLLILLGSDKVDLEKVKQLLGVKGIRMASPEEVEEITGYEPGGVPPISIYGVKTIMDKKVFVKKEVIAGGGTTVRLLRISPEEIQENVEDLSVEDISE